MELTNGFKKTEAGVIPIQWDVQELREVAKFENGKAHENCIVDFGPYVVVNSKFISTQGEVAKYSNEARFPLTKDDITMVMSDIPSGRALARCYLIDRDDAYTLNQRICALRATEVETKFLFYFLNRNKYFLGFDNGVGQTNLRKDEVLACPVAVPPTENEQRVIADALSDVDALINALDALITKKRHIKQGTMQQLLTGKKRIPGFHGDWEEKAIGELAEFANGKPYESKIVLNGSVNLITLDSVSIDGSLKPDHKRVNFLDGSLQKGDLVLILSDLAHGYFLGMSCVIPEDDAYVLNQRVGRLRVLGDDDIRYLRLQINARQNFFRERGQGTSQKHIYRRDVDALVIPLPDPDEQSAIASVLSDMDSEIAALEQKRDKTKLIKQGMMQELLTGKTRLV